MITNTFNWKFNVQIDVNYGIINCSFYSNHIFFRFFIVDSCIPKGAKYFDSQSHSIDYKGDQSCKKCHAAEFKDWKHSDHYMSLLQPNDSTVKKELY